MCRDRCHPFWGMHTGVTFVIRHGKQELNVHFQIYRYNHHSIWCKICNSSNINPFYPQEYNNIPIHQIMLPLNPHVSPVWMVFSDCTSLKQPYCPISSNEIPSNPFIFSSVSHYQIYVSHQEKSIVNRKFLAYDMKNRENTTKYQWHNIFVHVPIIMLVIYHDISHHIPTNNARHYCWWLHHHLVVVGPPLSQFYRYTSLYILLVTPKEISTELSPSHQS